MLNDINHVFIMNCFKLVERFFVELSIINVTRCEFTLITFRFCFVKQLMFNDFDTEFLQFVKKLNLLHRTMTLLFVYISHWKFSCNKEACQQN